MSFVGTFGSFTTARLGIYAAQKGLSVTGNNIANINTRGYTRQSLDQISLRTTGSDRYQSQSDAHVGNGVLCTGVSQIRDPYLDIRYRTEMASVGAMDTKLSGLEDLASVFDEVVKGKDGNGLIEAQFSDLIKALENLSHNAGQKEYDTLVRSSASALVSLFNTYAKKLDVLEKDTVNGFNQNIETVNKILNNIRDLNSTICKSEIHGDGALELRDERNRLIDELSKYMKLDVIYTMDDIGEGQMVEKLTIKLANTNPGSLTANSTLVDGVYATQIGITQVPKPNPNYDPGSPDADKKFQFLMPDGTGTNDQSLAAKIDNDNFNLSLDALKNSNNQVMKDAAGNDLQPVNLADNDLYGALQAARELLTEAGEFVNQDTINTVDKNAAIKRGIPYYHKSLDLLANQFAKVFNKANTGELVDKDGNVIPGKTPVGSGNLFSNSGDGDDGTGITAGNISISAKWAKGDVHVVNTFEEGAGSTTNSNILHMISLMDKKLVYDPTVLNQHAASNRLFEGSFQEMLNNINSVLGNDRRSTGIMLDTYYNASVELDTSRDSASGVDLNDEAASLMQYQKSYAAACRLMTTLDEAIDKLINGTGIVGR